jgi:hypothetical protein
MSFWESLACPPGRCLGCEAEDGLHSQECHCHDSLDEEEQEERSEGLAGRD